MTETITSVSSVPKDVKRRSSSTATPTERLAIGHLVKAAWDRGEDITGPDRLLKSITATVLQAALQKEMTEHLRHAKHQAPDGGAANIRNWTRAKTVLTDAAGQVAIEVPRDSPPVAGVFTDMGAPMRASSRLWPHRMTRTGSRSLLRTRIGLGTWRSSGRSSSGGSVPPRGSGDGCPG